jgi:hypothetical protein
MKKKLKKKLFPLPEAIDGSKWDIRDGSSAMTDVKSRTMYVPSSDSPEDEYLRAHETAHARITPKIPPGKAAQKSGATVEAIQTCEDLRVNAFLERRHIDRHGSLGSLEMACCVAKAYAKDPRKLASLLVASCRTDDYDYVKHAIKEVCDGETAHAIINGARGVDAMFSELTDRLSGRGAYRSKRSPLSSARGFTDVTIPVARLFDAMFPPDGDFISGEPDALASAVRHNGARDSRWGKLLGVVRAKMSRARKERGTGGKSWRDEGAVPVAPYRLLVDGRIFCRKKRLKGGTVLVDVSGSMSLSSDDIARIVTIAPGAVVAAYSGAYESGHVVIVAERGRMASERDLDNCGYMHGGNIIDGPALQWLAKMPGPRVWVSDGFVTGVHDDTALNLVLESRAICRQGGITRVERPDAAAEELK